MQSNNTTLLAIGKSSIGSTKCLLEHCILKGCREALGSVVNIGYKEDILTLMKITKQQFYCGTLGKPLQSFN